MRAERSTWFPRVAVGAAVTVALMLGTLAPAGAVVDKTPKSTWQANGRVSAIVRVGNTLYLGGQFTRLFDHAGHAVNRAHLAAVNAGTGAVMPWNPGTNGPVRALALAPNKKTLYVGGAFSRVAGADRPHVAAFGTRSGSLRRFHAAVFGGQIRAVVATSKKVYIGGSFTRVDGRRRIRLAGLSRRGDVLKWYPGRVNGPIRAMSLPVSNRLVIGGDFDRVGTKRHSHLAAVSPSSGAVQSWQSHPARDVIAMTAARGSVYVGTRNDQANRYAPSNGALKFSRKGNGDVQALAVFHKILYIGGHFTAFGGRNEGHLAAMHFDTGGFIDWKARANSTLGVFAMLGDGHLYIGGDFTKVTKRSQARFAMFAGS